MTEQQKLNRVVESVIEELESWVNLSPYPGVDAYMTEEAIGELAIEIAEGQRDDDADAKMEEAREREEEALYGS